MNSRHAAALTLVGWYLMVAPTKQIGPFMTVENPPISKWNRQDHFDSKEQCETVRAEYLAYPPLPLREFKDQLVAECVSTDDPRLKKK